MSSEDEARSSDPEGSNVAAAANAPANRARAKRNALLKDYLEVLERTHEKGDDPACSMTIWPKTPRA